MEYKPNSVEQALNLIRDIAVDYDGYHTVDGLKSIIDEMASYANEAIELISKNVCKNCAHWHTQPNDCPMTHQEVYDDDGWTEYYTVDHTLDSGSGHCDKFMLKIDSVDGDYIGID